MSGFECGNRVCRGVHFTDVEWLGYYRRCAWDGRRGGSHCVKALRCSLQLVSLVFGEVLFCGRASLHEWFCIFL